MTSKETSSRALAVTLTRDGRGSILRQWWRGDLRNISDIPAQGRRQVRERKKRVSMGFPVCGLSDDITHKDWTCRRKFEKMSSILYM